MNPFALFYTIVATLLYIVALPFLLLFSLKKKYSRSIPARFFLWKNPPLQENGIWIHSCSFGEARAVKPLLKRIPESLIRLTTTTDTGYVEISKQTRQSRFLPYESLLFFWIRRQRLLLVMEAELWYLLFFLARKRGTRTILINARMNERSYPKYLRIKWFYDRIFQQIDAVYAQSAKDKERLESLGAHNVTVLGNMKFVEVEKASRRLKKPPGITICAASTHEGEEALILSAFHELRNIHPDARLIIAPRHPERFTKVAGMIRDDAHRHGWRYQRYSMDKDLTGDIILIDSLGELINFYLISDVVILGGAFEPVGGHNAAEAAQYGCRIISGEHYFNQQDIFAGIEGITIVKKEALADVLKNPLLLPGSRIRREVDLQPLYEEIEHVL